MTPQTSEPRERHTKGRALPVTIRFPDGTVRCSDCKGYGLVRKMGSRAGVHYKSATGAHAALARRRAKPCPVCGGDGYRVRLDTRRLLASWGTDRAGVIAQRVRMGLPVVEEPPPPF